MDTSKKKASKTARVREGLTQEFDTTTVFPAKKNEAARKLEKKLENPL